MKTERLVIILILVTAALRIVVASFGGLGFDESYMVSNARTFALSYLDDPPLHIWLVGAWAKLLGSEDTLLLRLPFIVLFAGSTWLMFRLTTRLFNKSAGLWAAIFFNLAPVFTLAHASWVLPDGPLIFFLLAAATIGTRILFDAPPPSYPTLWWLGAGICTGLALLSKYHGAFLLLALFLFLLTTPNQRRWLATPGPWLGVLVATLIFLPAIVWNIEHGLIGFFFQLHRVSGSHGLTLKWLLQSVGGQILYLTPWLFVPLAYCLGRALWCGPSAPRIWYLALLAVGPIAFFTAMSLLARGLPHWEMPGWLFTFPLLGAECAALMPRWRNVIRTATAVAAVFLVTIIGLLTFQSATGALGRAVPGLFTRRDPTIDLLNWTPLASALKERKLIDQTTPAAAAVHWMEAGKVNYAIGRSVPVLCLCSDPQEFAYLTDPRRFAGKDVIIIGTRHFLLPRLDAIKPLFERIEPLAPVIIRRSGVPALELLLFRGVGFKPRPERSQNLP